MLVSVKVVEGLKTLLPFTVVKASEGDTVFDIINGVVNRTLLAGGCQISPGLKALQLESASSCIQATIGKTAADAMPIVS